MQTNLRQIPPFTVPRWCHNGHLQTIGRSLTARPGTPPVERLEISTPDDDFLELDCAFHPDSTAVITLFHGLEGSSRRYYIAELVHHLLDKNFSVVAVNFRSCGFRMNRQPRFYHSGDTDDYATVFQWVREHCPDQKIGAVGFSLGANALLKSLGEERAEHPAEVAVAVSAPYDLYRGSMQLSSGFHRIYGYYFLRTLDQKLREKRQQYPALPTFEGHTLFEFDDTVTAPIHGFDSAEHYYRQCSCRQFIPPIRKRCLLIHSRQDPICPVEAMPMDQITDNPVIDYLITDTGGHVGFYGRPRNWLNTVIGDYLTGHLPGSKS